MKLEDFPYGCGKKHAATASALTMASEIRSHVCCPHYSHTNHSRITESLLFLTYMLSPAYYFTFMLPCIVTDFFLNNQQDSPVIQIYSVIKLYMFQASSLPIIRSFLLYKEFHPDSAWKRSSKTCMKLTSAECRVKTPHDEQRKCPKHVEFYNRINLDSWCVWMVI
jgi:hypothetical protein